LACYLYFWGQQKLEKLLNLKEYFLSLRFL